MLEFLLNASVENIGHDMANEKKLEIECNSLDLLQINKPTEVLKLGAPHALLKPQKNSALAAIRAQLVSTEKSLNDTRQYLIRKDALDTHAIKMLENGFSLLRLWDRDTLSYLDSAQLTDLLENLNLVRLAEYSAVAHCEKRKKI